MTTQAPFKIRTRANITLLSTCLLIGMTAEVCAQSVCLPVPRLLLTKPLGGQVGTTLDVTVSGDNLDGTELLRFSHQGITATPKLDEAGLPIENQFTVTVAADCPTGIHEARVFSRLGISSSRVFNVSNIKEVQQQAGNTTFEKAMPLEVNSICNAAMTRQAIDHYKFPAKEGQRILVDCAAKGIDSKATPVLIVADANGQDLKVERRGGAIDFTVPETAEYVIKVHDLTFNGSAQYFYRLSLTEQSQEAALMRLPSTQAVNAFSWPPVGLSPTTVDKEIEPNNRSDQAQQISLPCDLTGSFAKAADVELFEFTAKQGETWWVEVASERLGRPTDPTIVVQHITETDGKEVLTDVVELTDIGSPVKVSTVQYAYNGPPYNAGSTDVLGKLEIKTDGRYRLQLHDLFGGTRNDPNNVYRLIIRKAEPDFALVAWAMHMELRNGDRNALSKPIALRNGATLPYEVAVVRRDGFNGPIELFMKDLPEGVTATGLTIPAGKSQGTLLVTAKEDAPRGLSTATLFGRATINDQEVERPIHMASMAWPVTNHWNEIPQPRLVADVPVSVCGSEQAPFSVAAAESKLWEVTEGETLTIPLEVKTRMDFSGASITFKTFGTDFGSVPAFEVPLDGKDAKAVLDLAKLKTKPGEYTIAFYGRAVAKYSYHPEAVASAQTSLDQAKKQLAELEESQKQFAMTEAETATTKEKSRRAQELAKAKAAVASAERTLKSATATAKPKDIVDIVATEPIRIRVLAKAGEANAQ